MDGFRKLHIFYVIKLLQSIELFRLLFYHVYIQNMEREYWGMDSKGLREKFKDRNYEGCLLYIQNNLHHISEQQVYDVVFDVLEEIFVTAEKDKNGVLFRTMYLTYSEVIDRFKIYDECTFFSFMKMGDIFESSFVNNIMAKNCYEKAEYCLKYIYGYDNPILKFMGGVQCQYYSSQKAIEMILDAGSYIYSCEQTNKEDAIIDWILDNKKEFLIKLAKSFYELAFQSNEENFDISNILLNSILKKDNLLLYLLAEEGIQADERFDFLNEDFNFAVQNQSNIMNVTNVSRILTCFAKQKECTLRDISNMIGEYKTICESFPDSGWRRYLESRFELFQKVEILDALQRNDRSQLRNITDMMHVREDVSGIKEELDIKQQLCFLYLYQRDIDKVKQLLEDIRGLLENLVVQFFFLNDFAEKKTIIENVSNVITNIIFLYNETSTIRTGYEFVLRYKNFYLNYANIKLSISDTEKLLRTSNLNLEEIFNENSEGLLALSVNHLQDTLRENESFIDFTKTVTYGGISVYGVYYITKWNIQYLEIPIHIDTALNGIYNKLLNKEANIELSNEMYMIFQKVVQPIGLLLSERTKVIYISPINQFMKIPFELFPSFKNKGNTLGDEYIIHYINGGVDIINSSYKHSNDTNIEHSLVLGINEFDSDNLPKLNNIAHEISSISHILNTEQKLNDFADWKGKIKSVDITHLATHTIMDENENEDILDSIHIYLSDKEKISMREISQMNLSNLSLLSLSTCGQMNQHCSFCDGTYHFGSVFLQAKVKTILLNLWESDDCACAIIMIKFYENYMAGISAYNALQCAKKYVRETKLIEFKGDKALKNIVFSSGSKDDDIPFKNPYYWAGYVIVGGRHEKY